MTVQSAGLSLVPKLKMEHVELTYFSRMRVDLAAQVSNSNTCGDELQLEIVVHTFYAYIQCIGIGMCTCLHIDTCTHVKVWYVSCIHVLCLYM